jgi:hypothetical protein
MTYFEKFLMRGLSKYYKENYHDFLKKILKLFVEYSKNKKIQKIVPKGWCGSCYCVYTHETFVTKIDMLIRTSVLDIKQ